MTLLIASAIINYSRSNTVLGLLITTIRILFNLSVLTISFASNHAKGRGEEIGEIGTAIPEPAAFSVKLDIAANAR